MEEVERSSKRRKKEPIRSVVCGVLERRLLHVCDSEQADKEPISLELSSSEEEEEEEQRTFLQMTPEEVMSRYRMS